MTLAWLLLQFLLCAVLIGAAGFVLSRSADRLARFHGWDRGWVGLAMLATVTSLPELSTGISAVAWVGAPNLAAGDALGSCVFNLVFLVVIDALQPDQPMYRGAGPAHQLSAAFGVVMLGFVAMSLLLSQQVPRVFHVGLYSVAMVMLYALALHSVSRHERSVAAALVEAATEEGAEPTDARREWRHFGLASVVVLVAGSWLPQVADGLAHALGLSRSFVGTLWLAFATSLPEIAVSLSALRLGALDLAISNLLGSNLFNVLVLALDDAAYVRGPLLADVEPVHAATAVAAVVMTGLVMIGLVLRPHGRVMRRLSWVSIGLVAVYLLNAWLLFLRGGG
jgi:cation:H+ antiporter